MIPEKIDLLRYEVNDIEYARTIMKYPKSKYCSFCEQSGIKIKELEQKLQIAREALSFDTYIYKSKRAQEALERIK